MENRSHALLAGLFVVFLGLSAVAALWWFGGQQEASNEYLVLSRKNITGLNLQAQVRYRGVRVGRVESIELDPADVGNTLIHIRIRKMIPVTRATTAKLGYQGVTGIAHILLEDSGTDSTPLMPPANGGLPRIAMQDSMIQELSDVGAETLRNTRDLIASANQLLSPENRQNISKMLSNLETTTGNAQAAMAQLRLLLTPENVRLLHATLAHAEQTAGQAAPFFAEARALVARLQSVSEKLETTLGDPSTGGAATLIPRLNELTSELSANSQQINRVLRMLENAPQSLIFGTPRASSGPGEPGFNPPTGGKGQP